MNKECLNCGWTGSIAELGFKTYDNDSREYPCCPECGDSQWVQDADEDGDE